MSSLIICSILLPIVSGIFLMLPVFKPERSGLKKLFMVLLAGSAVLTTWTAWSVRETVEPFEFMKGIALRFRIDGVSQLFVMVVTIAWLLAGLYSLKYMEHEKNEKRYYGFYLIVYGVLTGLDFSGNLVTMYLFYELMTITSVPLVLHNESKEAIMASLKYLFYSMCGAYMGLFSIFILYRYCETLDFIPGGSLIASQAVGHEGILLLAVFFALIGFGAKAGMFPLHAWLPAAHPVAPSPASAVLSGVIVKSGVLAVIRVIYYLAGPELIRGTWVQYAWMSLTLLTVFMGSMMAYGEPIMKKRLAYSTVSQVSYILFGLSLLTPEGMTGALLHTVFHACIKTALFLTAGVFLFYGERTRVDQLRGVGREMPAALWCYTIVSLGLIGIPPLSGFVSKWYLASGALKAPVGVFSWLGPVILLVSALLTAGYLLPVTIQGFFPGSSFDDSGVKKREPAWGMLVPLIILAGITVLLGMYPGMLTGWISQNIVGLL